MRSESAAHRELAAFASPCCVSLQAYQSPRRNTAGDAIFVTQDGEYKRKSDIVREVFNLVRNGSVWQIIFPYAYLTQLSTTNASPAMFRRGDWYA